MLKKIFIILLIVTSCRFAIADSYYEAGERYMRNYQYSSAIDQFKNALRQNPTDYNARIGLINAYLARSAYNFNTAKDYQKSLNDSRSGLYYIRYYDNSNVNITLQSAAEKTERNIREILNILKPNTTPEGLLASAKQLRNQSELPSSFIVYQQLMNTKYDREATIASGDILKVLKNPSMAIVYYNKILRQEPKNYDLLIKIGECYQEVGNTSLAAENFNKALTESKNSTVALNNLEKIWRQQIYKTPSDAEAHANLGVIYQQKGDYISALSEYQKAEQFNPNNMTTKLNLGTLYQEQQKYEQAITMYDKVLSVDVQNTEARKYKAQCLKALGKTDEALVEYKRILALNPNNKEVKSIIVSLAATSSNPDEYMSILAENGQTNSEKVDSLYQIAYDLHKNKRYEEAKKYYLKTIELNPQQADAYLNLSDVYMQLNDKTSAVAILNDAKTKFPTNSQIVNRVNQLKLAENQKVLEEAGKNLLSGNYEKALSLYKSIQPQTSESLQGIASTYQTMEKYNEAIEYYKKAANLEPNNIEIAYYIASAYSTIDDFYNSKIYINKVLAKNPNHQNAKTLKKYIEEEETQSSINKALDLYNAKNYQDAYALLTEMITKNPSSSVAYYYRGMVLDEQKKYEAAISDYKNTIKIDPQFDLAYYSLGVDYDTLKNYKEAFSYYNKYLKATKEQNEYTQYVQKRIEELKKYVPNLAQAN